MRPVYVTVGPLAAGSAAYYAASATPVSGTPLTLAATVSPDQARRVLLTPGSEASPRTLVLTGTAWDGRIISETLSVPASSTTPVQSVLDYLTLTSALPLGGGWTNAMTLGTSGVASSPYIILNRHGLPMTSLQVVVSGTINYTPEETLDSLDTVAKWPLATWFASPSALAAQTTSLQGSYVNLPYACRLTVNSSTSPAKATLAVMQSGVSNT